ncbi:MAG: universal stress protein [Gammaproteobacteria bacterium]
MVMGTRWRQGLSRLRFGSVADAVLRYATCPVLTVRSSKFSPGHRFSPDSRRELRRGV